MENMECVECGYCPINEEELENCEKDNEENLICPFCGAILKSNEEIFFINDNQMVNRIL